MMMALVHYTNSFVRAQRLGRIIPLQPALGGMANAMRAIGGSRHHGVYFDGFSKFLLGSGELSSDEEEEEDVYEGRKPHSSKPLELLEAKLAHMNIEMTNCTSECAADFDIKK